MLEKLTGLGGEDLLKDEVVLASAYISWRAETKEMISFILALVVSAALLIYSFTLKNPGMIIYVIYLFSLAFFLAAAMIVVGFAREHYGTRYFLTNYRVIKRTGIFTKKIDYVMYSKIQDVKISKGIAERIMDIGDIHIDVAGRPDVEMILENVPDPEKFNKIIMEKLREREKMCEA